MAVIRIQKRTWPEWLARYLLLMPFFLPALQTVLPSLVKYTLDAVWVALTGILLCRRKLKMHRSLAPALVWILVYAGYTLLGAAANFQAVRYYLWGVRNNFRYYGAFFAYVMILDAGDVEELMKFLDKLFWINAALSLIQFLMGFDQDNLGGIFGTDRGVNSSTLIFFILVVTNSVLGYMNGEERLGPCWRKCAAALIICALAEVKFFFLVFVLILLASAVLTKFSHRKTLLLLAAAVALPAASLLMARLFGQGSSLSLERIRSLIFAEHYATGQDLGRLNAFSVIDQRFLRTWPQRLFGLGLGNCDTSAFPLVRTPFYAAYGDLNYTWLFSAMLYLEVGAVGLGMVLGFFAMLALRALGRVRRGGRNLRLYQMAVIFNCLWIGLVFYNSSLRMEMGYVAWFGAALGLIGEKSEGMDG